MAAPLPVGGILAYGAASLSAPAGFDVGTEGWLLCDGAQLKQADYPELFAAIGTANGGNAVEQTFTLPDLRGFFLRGADAGSNRDPNAANRVPAAPGGDSGPSPGSKQPWATGVPFNNQVVVPNSITGDEWAPGGASGVASKFMTVWTDATFDYPLTTDNPSAETRPANSYVHFIIKVTAGTAAAPTRVPIAAIYPHGSGINLPSEAWQACNGNLVDNRSKKFVALVGPAFGGTANGVYLPDFSYRFLRGVTGQSNVDPDSQARYAPRPQQQIPGNAGNAVGSGQDSASGPPKQPFQVSIQHNGLPDQGREEEFPTAGRTNVRDGPVSEVGVPAGDSETRPINVALPYWIKTAADEAGATDANFPIGGIIAFPAGSPAKAGWALCDGSPQDPKGSYAPLYQVITYEHGKDEKGNFRLPDLRGRFIRGLSGEELVNADPSRTLPPGLQPGDFNTLTGTLQGAATKLGAGWRWARQLYYPTDNRDNSAAAPNTGNHLAHWNGNPGTYNLTGGDVETRPVNVAVSFLIKYSDQA